MKNSTNNVTTTTCYDQQYPAKKLISENVTLDDFSFLFFYPNYSFVPKLEIDLFCRELNSASEYAKIFKNENGPSNEKCVK